MDLNELNLENLISEDNSEDEVKEIKSNVESLELYSDEYPFRLPLRIRNFDDEKSYFKFIKACEGLIRKSPEYKLWREYIVDVLGINRCMLTQERMEEVTIEVHHHVPSLFLVVKAIINKFIEEKKEFSTFDICLEVISLHFANKIGYLTLIKSIHEKFHNGFLRIPSRLVRGDYQNFIANYGRYLDDEDLDSINERLAANDTNISWARDDYKIASEG